MTIFEADWICPVHSPPLANAALSIRGNLIEAVSPLPTGDNGERQRAAEGIQRVTFPNCAIIPGFVNPHTHLELTILRGFLENLSFFDWIRKLTTAKYKHLTREQMLLSARLGAVEMLRAGVTCVGEVMDLGVAWQAIRETPLQGVVFQEVFGPDERIAEQQLAGLREKVERLRCDESATLRTGVSPHAPYSVSARLYALVRDYAQSAQLSLTTHIAESADEGLFLRFGGGVFAEFLAERGIELPPAGMSPVAYLNRLGLVNEDILLAHVIDIEDDDLRILRERKPRVVHCPKSNAKLGHGVARISDMREMGLTLGLGTDSVASNNAVDMFEEMRFAIFQQRARTGRLDALDAQTALRMATLGGAECLGLSDLFGSLEPGKRADFVIVDLNDIGAQPVYDPVEAMVYSASRLNVRAVYIGGREVKIDTEGLLSEAREVGRRLKNF